MNILLAKIGAAVVTVTVLLFALFLIVGFPFGAYVVCMILPLGYCMTAAGFQNEAEENRAIDEIIKYDFMNVFEKVSPENYDKNGLREAKSDRYR